MRPSLSRWIELAGTDLNLTGHGEKLISAVGGFLGIAGILWVTNWFVAGQGAAWVVASMGASAVLLFAVPHSPLAQPWNLFGGHVFSAIIGVTCFLWVPHTVVAAALAVGLAIGVMHYLGCIHPPGGASALAAVVGGESVHALGYQYVLTPVLLNACVIFAVALLVNYPFAWRRYPAAWVKRPTVIEPQLPDQESDLLSHADLSHALRSMQSFIDVTEIDLRRIIELAQQHAHATGMLPAHLQLGGYYSNGRYGHQWSVRRIIDAGEQPDPDKALVIYRGVAGEGRGVNGKCTRAEFARWAKYEVMLNENSWQRVAVTGHDHAP